MATYQILINERTSLGRSIIAFLRSMPQAVTFQRRERKAAHKSELYKSLDSAFCDVRLMLDGKKKKKTLDELIDELRNSND